MKAFRKLFDQYYTPLCLHALRITDDFDASEDIVQSLFVTIWERQLHSDPNIDIRSYLYTAVRNNALQYMRQHDRHILVPLTDDIIIDDTPCTPPSSVSISHLSSKEQEALRHVVIDEHSYKEASTTMGISINTLKTHLRRAMQKLRSKG